MIKADSSIPDNLTTMHKNLQAIVLAGGKSTRFNTGKSKLLEKICGLEMVLYPIKILEELSIDMTLLVGHQKENIIEVVQKNVKNSARFVEQQEQKGTGHALLCTQSVWEKEYILVLNADIPLLNTTTLQAFINNHFESQSTVSFITARVDEEQKKYALDYGKVIQEHDHIRIVEAKDCPQNLLSCSLINAGVYLFKKDFLLNHIHNLEAQNKAHEFYITDLIYSASKTNNVITMYEAPFNEIRGVNTLFELTQIEKIKNRTLIHHWMNQGVRFYHPESTFIDYNVSIGAGTTLGSGVHLLNGSSLGNNCTIESFACLKNAHLADNVTIFSHSIISNSHIGQHSTIGPFAHIEEHCMLGQSISIGNFVQVKRSHLDNHVKAKHLAFLGDARIGNNTNIGAGTITCNYDGAHKHQTIIHDHCFIGSNNTLIAPLIIGSHSFLAAGSTITDSIPPQSFAIGRNKQTTKLEYAHKIRKKLQTTKQQKGDHYPTTHSTQENNNRNEL